jgi:hypothetical protein
MLTLEPSCPFTLGGQNVDVRKWMETNAASHCRGRFFAVFCAAPRCEALVNIVDQLAERTGSAAQQVTDDVVAPLKKVRTFPGVAVFLFMPGAGLIFCDVKFYTEGDEELKKIIALERQYAKELAVEYDTIAKGACLCGSAQSPY